MKRNAIGVEDAVLLDNKLWFILSDYKSLVSMDVETKETKSYTIPAEGPYVLKQAYASLALVERKIYLIPSYERCFFYFDIDLEQFIEIKLADDIMKNKLPLFMGIGIYQNYLFIMGVKVPAILRINILNNCVDYITDWRQKVEKLIFDTEDAYFRKQSIIVDDKLFVPFCNANAVLEIDCNSMETIVHIIGEERQGYSGICNDGSSIWLSPRKNGSMVRWNIYTNQVDTIWISELEKLGNTYSYAGIISHNEKIILLPMNNRETMHIKMDNVYELRGSYKLIQDNEKNIIIHEINSRKFTVINKQTQIQTDFVIDRVSVDLGKLLSEKQNLIVENEMNDIRNFLEYIYAL